MDKTGDFSEQIQSTSARPPYSTIEKGRQDVANSLKCCECDGKIIKETNKSKSRVWKKVMWFTRRSKIDKQTVCQCHDLGTDFQHDLTSASERHSNSWSFTRSASRKFRISSRKRQCKSDIAKKPSHSHARSVHGSCIKEKSETCNNYRADSPTATGSFCDFGSSCHVSSRAARNIKHASVLTGIARELNPPVLPPLRDLRHHPLDPVSKSLSSMSPLSEKGVRRWNSFSGPFTNSFKRRNSGPQYKTGGVSSPPLKQKCYGLRRTATFSGKLNTEFINAQVRKSKSANTADFMKLEKASSSMGEIRDQDGSIIGIVHFYKSPKSTCIKGLSSFNHGVKTTIISSPEEVHVPTNVPKNQGSTSNVEIINFNERPNEKTPFPRDCSYLQKSIREEDQTSSQESTSNMCQPEEAVFVNSFSSPDILTSFPHLQDSRTSSDTGVINNGRSTSFLETGMDLSPILCSPDSPSLSSTMVDDGDESCSMILPGSVSVEYSSLLTEEISVPQDDEAVLENSELIGAEMEEQTVADCLSDCSLSAKDQIFESTVGNPSPSVTVQGTGSAIEGVSCDQDEISTGVHTNPDISLTMLEPFNDPSMNNVPDRVQMSEHTNEDKLFSEIQEGSNNVCTNPMFEEQQLLDNKSDQGVHISVYNENTNLNFQKDGSSNSFGITNSSSNILNRNYLDDNPMGDSEQPEIQGCPPSIADKTVDTFAVGTSDICGASSLKAVEDICEFGINENSSLDRFLDDKIPLTELPETSATQSKQTEDLSKPCTDLKNAFACNESVKNCISNDTQIRDTCTPMGKEDDPSLPHVCKYMPDERDGGKECSSESSEKVRSVWKQGVPLEDVRQSAPVLAINDDGKLGKNAIQVLDTSNTSDYASCSDEDLSNQSIPISPWKTSKQAELMSDELGLPVPGQVFKMRTELLMSWFDEFNDEQKNIVMKKLLNRCELPQMHLLSVAMENNLHKSCPPNCQDMLVWLPYTVTLKILTYLDPVSLCHCNQVNKAWSKFANNPLLWQQLTRSPEYQLSEDSSRIQYLKYTRPNGKIHWKKVLAERFLLQRNWLNGKYKLRTYQGHNQGIACVQFDDTRIVSGSSDKTIKLWDISSTTCELMLTLEGHSGTVRCLDLNGNRLVSGSTDRTIKVWDLSFASYWAGASCKVTMVGHLHTVRCLQADDKKLVSGSYDKTVKVWDLKTGQCQLTLRGHTAAVLCVQFDDQKIVSGSYDKKIKVWDLAEGTCLMTLDGHQDAVTCLNLTHDGMKIITGSLDYSLKFWDLFTGKCYGTLDWITSEGHTAVVRCLQVDSWRIISGGDDKTLKVWQLATGQRLLTLRCHSDGVTCMQFNDFAIVSGSYDRTVKLWDFTPKHPYLEASN